MKNRRDIISVARGEVAADLILANARIVNVFTGQVETGNVAVCDGLIAGVGDYREAASVIDVEGKYVAPGFIDGHVHLESSMLGVPEYARAVVPRGTLAVVTDLHEIANVAGLAGLKYSLDSARSLPLDVFLMAPSCVPATSLETAGAELDAAALRQISRWKQCIGLGEMMNFPGVLASDADTLAKINLFRGMALDGHAPSVTGHDLNAYAAAGIGSDHESVALAEASEKIHLGLHIMIREGSSEKNLESLLPLVTDRTYPRCMFVVDDRSCLDLLNDGDLDSILRKAVGLGLDPVRAIQMVTINPATYFHLGQLGAVAPGYFANLVVLDDLAAFTVDSAFYRGRLVAQLGKPLFPVDQAKLGDLERTVHIGHFVASALKAKAPGEEAGARTHIRVIEVVPGQIITKSIVVDVNAKGGEATSDRARDILKLAVVERHRATGRVGIGFVRGFGLTMGALASSVAHDSHNIVAVGVDDESILSAVREIERLQGGIVVTQGPEVISSLPLPICGLLSGKSVEETAHALLHVESAARGLGTTLASPFSTLSFLALPVIPELRLTDRGLVDVHQFRFVDLFV